MVFGDVEVTVTYNVYDEGDSGDHYTPPSSPQWEIVGVELRSITGASQKGSFIDITHCYEELSSFLRDDELNSRISEDLLEH